MIAQHAYQVGIYTRLSKDDERQGESISIENQKLILTQYCNQQGWTIIDYYVDDGWTGTNFNRPGFQRMIADVQNRRINLILVKDLSRLGRDYIEVGKYTDCVFPYYNCRFIALNDGVDTIRQNDDISMIFKNVINDIYARDTSKKIRAVRRANAESGKYMGQQAPYGYKKSESNKHKLEIDPVAAAVVRHIFDLRLKGNGHQMVARILNREGIMPPSDYFFSIHGKKNPYRTNHLWSSKTVSHIIQNEVYIGHLVQLKYKSISYKDHRTVNRPQDEWVYAMDAHEPIIDMDTWNAVRRLDGKKFKPRITNDGELGLFSGFLKCADCGYGMKRTAHRKTLRGGIVKRYVYYICINYNQSGKVACSSHSISEDTLRTMVFEDIREKIAMIDFDESAVIKAIQSQREKSSKDSYKVQLAEKNALENRLIELQHLIQALYEDKVNGEISSVMYSKLMPKYEEEMQSSELRLREISALISSIKECNAETEDWVALIKRYRNITDVSRELLASLVEKIEIGDSIVMDGSKVQEIKIYYKFVGHVG